jgi:hypothetical protein
LKYEKHAAKHHDDDQVGNQRAVAQRPFGQIGKVIARTVPPRLLAAVVKPGRLFDDLDVARRCSAYARRRRRSAFADLHAAVEYGGVFPIAGDR